MRQTVLPANATVVLALKCREGLLPPSDPCAVTIAIVERIGVAQREYYGLCVRHGTRLRVIPEVYFGDPLITATLRFEPFAIVDPAAERIYEATCETCSTKNVDCRLSSAGVMQCSDCHTIDGGR